MRVFIIIVFAIIPFFVPSLYLAEKNDYISPASYDSGKASLFLLSTFIFLGAFSAIKLRNKKGTFETSTLLMNYHLIYLIYIAIQFIFIFSDNPGYSGMAVAGGLMIGFIPSIIIGFIIHFVISNHSKKITL